MLEQGEPGALAVSDVPEAFTTTASAGAPPTMTEAPRRFVPLTVMEVPPASGPELGETLAMVGSAT